jgi:hypothetical protein
MERSNGRWRSRMWTACDANASADAAAVCVGGSNGHRAAQHGRRAGDCSTRAGDRGNRVAALLRTKSLMRRGEIRCGEHTWRREDRQSAERQNRCFDFWRDDSCSKRRRERRQHIVRIGDAGLDGNVLRSRRRQYCRQRTAVIARSALNDGLPFLACAS